MNWKTNDVIIMVMLFIIVMLLVMIFIQRVRGIQVIDNNVASKEIILYILGVVSGYLGHQQIEKSK